MLAERDMLAPEMAAAIEMRGLRKVFDEVVAVEGIDLTIESGTVFGLLGSNGAGKSTTIKMCW